MKIETLTKEQEALLPIVRDKWINRFNSLPKINKEKSIEFVEFVYEISNLKKPQIIFMPSPMEAQKYVSLCKGKTHIEYESFSTYGNVGDYGWVSFYDYFIKAGILNNDLFNKYAGLLFESALYDIMTFENACIVIEMPITLHRNASGNLHNISGMAISWSDNYGQYYINGRNIPDDKYLMALQGKISKENWLNEKNEDIKAAWFEILGSEKVIQILEAEKIDSAMTIHANGELEEHILYKTPFILEEIGEALAWVKFTCPSTGSNYLISVNPKHNKVKDAVLDSTPFFNDEIKTWEDYSFNARG